MSYRYYTTNYFEHIGITDLLYRYVLIESLYTKDYCYMTTNMYMINLNVIIYYRIYQTFLSEDSISPYIAIPYTTKLLSRFQDIFI